MQCMMQQLRRCISRNSRSRSANDEVTRAKERRSLILATSRRLRAITSDQRDRISRIIRLRYAITIFTACTLTGWLPDNG